MRVQPGLETLRHAQTICLQLNPGRLRLHVHVDAFFAELVSPAGLLEAAERHVVVEHQLAVHLDAARLQALDDPVGPADVFGLGGRRQPVGGVVGHGDGLVLVVERQDRDHRPEDLLPVEPHAGVDVGQHRRVHEVALAVQPVAAGDHLDAIVPALIDEAQHPGELLLASAGR